MPYSWLALPEPFSIETAFGTDLQQTPLLAAAGFNITDQELSAGTPWHNSFVGPPGFNRLQVWVVDPTSGRVVTLGSGPGQGGIGTRLSTPQTGDWRSIKLDDYSNDRNVEVLNETEQGFAPTGDTNSRLPPLSSSATSPRTPRAATTFAAWDSRSTVRSVRRSPAPGGRRRRLQFPRHRRIGRVVRHRSHCARAGFRGRADRRQRRRRGPLEQFAHRADQSRAVVGIAQPMQAGFAGSSGPFTNSDFYSTNPLDAGMRVILPGTEGVVNTYFVRVRPNSSDLARLTGGLRRANTHADSPADRMNSPARPSATPTSAMPPPASK